MIGRVLNLLNRFIRKSYWYNNIIFADCEKFWNQTEFGLDIVNLGSTSARSAFNYSGTELKAKNWAMSPQTFVGDLEILRNYSCYLKENATVIIPICPFSCLGGYNLDLPDKYYTILNIASFPHASFIRRQNIFKIKSNPISAYPLVQLVSRKKKSVCNDFSKDAITRMNAWKHEFSIMRWEYPLSIVNKDAYNDSAIILTEIIDYCKSHNFRPVVVLPPVSNELNSLFTQEMKKLFITDFVQKASKTVLFLNYMDSPEFRDSSLYENSFLLNAKGGNLFTQRILRDIAL